jgi:ABC-type cobalt transport system substrate-binding protein
MDNENEELQKDLEEQYAMLEEELQEDKKRKRYLLIFIIFLSMFLIMFGTTFSYFKIYNNNETESEYILIKDLYIEGYESAFEFDSEINSYVVNVASNTKSLNIKYVLGCQNCEVNITGNDDLQPGTNEINVIVTTADGQEIKYIIYVIVEEDSNDTDNTTVSDNLENNDNNENVDTPELEEVKDLNLKSLSLTNHTLESEFNSNISSYIVKNIYNNEDVLEVNFKLADSSNNVSFKLNNTVVTRTPTIVEDQYKLKLEVKTELLLGANKLEISITDDNGNEKTYYLFLVVSAALDNDKTIEIIVENGNGDQPYTFDSIIPGWESPEKQSLRIINKSNYDVNVDINWVDVVNTFTNTSDLSYTLYLDDKEIKSDTLPTTDENLITNLKISANSDNNYLIGYKYNYSTEDQNVDQGKTFSTKINVTISK